MKNRTILVLIYLFAILLLLVFSFLPGDIQMYRNILALFLPLAIGVGLFLKKYGTKIPIYEGKGEGAFSCLFFAPILLSILLISLGTSLVTAFFGLENPLPEKIPPLEAVVTYALLPAILEEGLYRILPALALQEEDERSIAFFSSLIFTFAHLSLFSMPRALFGGLAFFFVNRLARSPLPSILLHFLNNLLSVILMYAKHPTVVFSCTLYALLGLTLLSLVLLVTVYREQTKALVDRLRAKKTPFRLSPDIVAYLVVTMTLTVLFF